MRMNYQKQLDEIINQINGSGVVPSLLLHSCCAPCSSYVLEYLSRYFSITVFYYNPNIYPESEYRKRAIEQQVFISKLNCEIPVNFIEGEYIPSDFYSIAAGLKDIPEGGERCFKCYRLRLEAAVRLAQEMHFDYFTTTLSISPHKNAEKLNEIGEQLSEIYSVKHLPSDFKKRDGYKRSIALSQKYGLYRQDYCGCIFSQRSLNQTYSDQSKMP